MLSPAFDSCPVAEELELVYKPSMVESGSSDMKSAAKKRTTELDLSDEELILAAAEHYQQDRLLAAARLLRTVQDETLLTTQHEDIIKKATACEHLIQSLKSPVSKGWTKQGESHGHYDSVIYFQMDPETNTQLTLRVETPMEASLLVPLLSVLNETELYPTWLPSWKKPIRLGVTQAEKLKQIGRASQVLRVVADMPWPLSPREAVISALALDDIAENGDICVKLHSLQPGEDGMELSRDTNAVRTRVDLEGGFLFRKCPPHHASSHKLQQNKILVCFSVFVDAKVQFLPQSVINFVVRTVIGRMWNKFLSVAEGVRDGKRPEHAAAIQEKRESLYDWVDQRVEEMLKQVVQDEQMDDHPENWF